MALSSTALAVYGLAVTAGGAADAAYSAKRGHDQQVQGQHEAADALAKQNALQLQLAATQKANQDRSDQEMQYQRQRAVALNSGSNYRQGTIRTSAQGIPAVGGAPRVGGNSYLGAA